MFSCLLTCCCGTTVLDIYLLLYAVQGIQSTKYGKHILVFCWYVVWGSLVPGNCSSRDEWKCFWRSGVEEEVAESHEVVIEGLKQVHLYLCETGCWSWFKMVHSPFFPNCTMLVTHFSFGMVFFFLQFYRCWCKNIVAMDQRKNDSFVPSITQLEDFLTEHDSNVVWLLVGKVNSSVSVKFLLWYHNKGLAWQSVAITSFCQYVPTCHLICCSLESDLRTIMVNDTASRLNCVPQWAFKPSCHLISYELDL